jgi:hypothetical protein
MYGKLSYDTQEGAHRSIRFHDVIHFDTTGGGVIDPSYRYNVNLPMNRADYPYWVPEFSDCGAGKSADQFLLSFQSDRSATFDITLKLKATDGTELQKRVIVETLVNNQPFLPLVHLNRQTSFLKNFPELDAPDHSPTGKS